MGLLDSIQDSWDTFTPWKTQREKDQDRRQLAADNSLRNTVTKINQGAGFKYGPLAAAPNRQSLIADLYRPAPPATSFGRSAQALHNGITGGLHNLNKYGNRAVETINPFDAQSRASSLIETLRNTHGIKSDLLDTMKASNPTYSDKLDSGGLKGLTAAGTYAPEEHFDPLHRIKLSEADSDKDVLLHEGLHAMWDQRPQVRGSFSQAYARGQDEELLKYLNHRLSPYRDRGTTPLSKLEALSPSMQTEVHSYIPEYLQYRREGNQPLRDYYNQYIDVARPQRRRGIRRQIQGALTPSVYKYMGVDY